MLKAYLAEKKELVEKNLQKILDRYQKPELYSEGNEICSHERWKKITSYIDVHDV